MPGDPAANPTRRLARAWMAAARQSLSGPEASALVSSDFKLNLPRSLAPLVEGAGLGVPAARLGDLDEQIRRAIAVDRCEVGKVDYDVFGEDRGGLQATVRIATRAGGVAEVQFAATFARTGDRLSEVWIHADTVELRQALSGA